MTICILEKVEESFLDENQKYEINFSDRNLIEKNWEILNKRRKGLYDGTLLRFLSLKEKENNLIIKVVADVKYKDLVGLRSKYANILKKDIFQVISCNIFVETSDRKSFFIERDAGDWSRALDMVGGFIQEKHNIKNVEEFVRRRVFEDLGLGENYISEIVFLDTYDTKDILELMFLYKVTLKQNFKELQKNSKVQLFEIPKDYSIQMHDSFFVLPVHEPLKNVLKYLYDKY